MDTITNTANDIINPIKKVVLVSQYKLILLFASLESSTAVQFEIVSRVVSFVFVEFKLGTYKFYVSLKMNRVT